MTDRNNSATPNHIISLNTLHEEMRLMSKRIDEVLAKSKDTRELAAATREKVREMLAPREHIMAALESRDANGKMRGHMTFSEIRDLLKCGNSSVIHHARQLVKQGKVVIVTRKGEHGKDRQEVFHADAVAL